jgi:hypothetical protein
LSSVVSIGSKRGSLVESTTPGWRQVAKGSSRVGATGVAIAQGFTLLKAASATTAWTVSPYSDSRDLREELGAKRWELIFSTVVFSAICLGSVAAILIGANPLFWTPIALGSLGVGGSSAIYLRQI